MRVLTEEMIEKYRGINPPFSELGEFVYYRTYSRWLNTQQRRENWLETISRAVDYNVSLVDPAKVRGGIVGLREEANDLMSMLFNLEGFLSGRTLWVGGTEVADKFPMSNFNCAFLIIDSWERFIDLFYLLMIGTGVGFRTLPEDVEQVHAYRTDVEVRMKEYDHNPKSKRLELSVITSVGSTVYIHVGDSKEGWVEALGLYFRIITSHLYRGVKRVIFNFDSVRPKGERLKTFGGTASGYESLRTMFTKIVGVITKAGGKLKPIDATDIANIIGENVVVGGVRRTSEIDLFSPTDKETLEAKKNISYVDADGNWQENSAIAHRRMSNNSIFFEEKPTREFLHSIFDLLKSTGEPAFVNGKELKRRNPKGKGCNPCGETLLDDEELCILMTVVMTAFVKNGKLDTRALSKAFRLVARASVRMTMVDLEMPSWDAKLKTDRLIGVSLTGWQDMVGMVGLSLEEEVQLLRWLRELVITEADDYADELGIPRPLLKTTLKPEGTLSQVAGGVSQGVHYSHSEWFIRRVRINAHDPLVQVAESLGWSVKAETGQDWDTCDTKVIEFPVHSGAKTTKFDVSAIKQLENYKMFMAHYVEHNASITVTVRDEEWEEVEQWMWDNWDIVVGVTFLSLDNHTYDLAPYEAITEERYLEMKSTMKPFDPSLLQQFEKIESEFEILEEACAGGQCPIR